MIKETNYHGTADEIITNFVFEVEEDYKQPFIQNISTNTITFEELSVGDLFLIPGKNAHLYCKIRKNNCAITECNAVVFTDHINILEIRDKNTKVTPVRLKQVTVEELI